MSFGGLHQKLWPKNCTSNRPYIYGISGVYREYIGNIGVTIFTIFPITIFTIFPITIFTIFGSIVGLRWCIFDQFWRPTGPIDFRGHAPTCHDQRWECRALSLAVLGEKYVFWKVLRLIRNPF